jgi:hypothetical protein
MDGTGSEGSRRFPPPWRAEPMSGGYVVRDANGQALAYLYSRADPTEAARAKVLTADEARHIGAVIFQQACRMGLEGIVSKRLSAPYRSGPSRDWIKVKNPHSPAMIRAREAEW